MHILMFSVSAALYGSCLQLCMGSIRDWIWRPAIKQELAPLTLFTGHPICFWSEAAEAFRKWRGIGAHWPKWALVHDQDQTILRRSWAERKCLKTWSIFNVENGLYRVFTTVIIDCERSLLSPGLDFRACERKGGTADNTSRNEIHVAHTTQNSHWSKSICLSIKSDM
jgi:hypothetical protein